MPSKDELKITKKQAKGEAKAAKKAPPVTGETAPFSSETGEKTPAERSAEAAEKQLQFHRWRVALAAASALIALISLLVLLLRTRGA